MQCSAEEVKSVSLVVDFRTVLPWKAAEAAPRWCRSANSAPGRTPSVRAPTLTRHHPFHSLAFSPHFCLVLFVKSFHQGFLPFCTGAQFPNRHILDITFRQRARPGESRLLHEQILVYCYFIKACKSFLALVWKNGAVWTSQEKGEKLNSTFWRPAAGNACWLCFFCFV